MTSQGIVLRYDKSVPHTIVKYRCRCAVFLSQTASNIYIGAYNKNGLYITVAQLTGYSRGTPCSKPMERIEHDVCDWWLGANLAPGPVQQSHWKLDVFQSIIEVLLPWWRHQMKAFSTLLALCTENSPVTGELPSQRPVTRNWFKTQSFSLWRHCNYVMTV